MDSNSQFTRPLSCKSGVIILDWGTESLTIVKSGKYLVTKGFYMEGVKSCSALFQGGGVAETRQERAHRLSPKIIPSFCLLKEKKTKMGKSEGKEVPFPHCYSFPFYKSFLLENWCFLPLVLK